MIHVEIGGGGANMDGGQMRGKQNEVFGLQKPPWRNKTIANSALSPPSWSCHLLLGILQIGSPLACSLLFIFHRAGREREVF